MSLFKRNRIWYYKFRFEKQRYRGSCKTANKRLAADYEKKIKAEVYKGRMLRKKKKLTLEILWELGLEKYPHKETQFNKLRGFRLHSKTKEKIPCARLTFLSVSGIFGLVRAREKEGVSQATIKQEMIALRQTLQYSQDLGYRVPSNLRFPKFVKAKKQPIRFLSVEEAEKFFQELDPKREGNGLPKWDNRSEQLKQEMQDAYDLAVLLLYTGGRYQELAGLKWEQVNLKKKEIRLYRKKVGNESIIQMAQPVEEVIRRRKQKAHPKYVFLNKQGTKRGYATRAFRSAFRRAGIDYNGQPAHILRKSYGSWLVQAGVSLFAVSKLLGHSSVTVTERTYADLAPNQAGMEAAKILDELPLLMRGTKKATT
jgi:integrase